MEVSTSNQERSNSKPVLESHLDLLSRGTLSDVTFIVGPSKERIPGHRALLAARSSVFEVMFSERWNHDKEIPLEHIDPNIFKKFLRFVYADDFVANVPETVELLQVARLYEVQRLVCRCEEELLANEMPLNDAVDVFQSAQKHDMIQLMGKAGDVISKSLSELESLPSFSRVDKETLVYVLSRDDLKMKEIDLFRLAVKWAQNQPDLTMEESLEDILPLIRFPVMTLEEFTNNVVPSGLLSQSTLLKVFTYFGSDAETKKSLAKTLKFNTQRRRSIDSVQYFDLYSGDLDEKETKVLKIEKLYDSLLISTPTTGTKAIGICGISFYCPARIGSRKSKPTSSTFMEFAIVLTHERESIGTRSKDRKVLLRKAPVKAEEGKMIEVKFDPVVPLEYYAHYRITVTEIPPRRTQQAASKKGYAVKVFDRHRNSEVNLNIIDSSVVMEIINDRAVQALLASFAGARDQPQLICRFALEEL